MVEWIHCGMRNATTTISQIGFEEDERWDKRKPKPSGKWKGPGDGRVWPHISARTTRTLHTVRTVHTAGVQYTRSNPLPNFLQKFIPRVVSRYFYLKSDQLYCSSISQIIDRQKDWLMNKQKSSWLTYNGDHRRQCHIQRPCYKCLEGTKKSYSKRSHCSYSFIEPSPI